MPSTETVRRQRALGGGFGLVVLCFGLSYHFFPGLLRTSSQLQGPAVAPLASQAPNIGFDQRPQAAPRLVSEVDSGPPLMLASAAVIAAHRREPAPAPEGAAVPDSAESKKLLERATQALAADHLTGGPDSALALYNEVLKANADSVKGKAGVVEVHARLLAEAEQALALGDGDTARERMKALKTIPDSTADAAALDDKLKLLDQVQPLLAQAADLVQQDKAASPAGGSALDLYRQVLSMDPGNAVASQGMAQVQRIVLDRALTAVAKNDFAGADKALADAAAIQPDAQALQDTRGRVEGMRRQSAEGLLAQARSALDAGDQALAARLAKQAQGISPDLAGLDEFNERMTNARLYASYKPGQVFSDRFVDSGGQGPAMVVLPTGSFQMGSADEEKGHDVSESPRHAVDVAKGFALSRSEVTVGQFREFVRATGYVPDSQKLGGSSIYDEASGGLRDDAQATWMSDYVGKPAADGLPVINVSWNDARAFVAWLASRSGQRYRLPSEAEFEYAERGGSTTRFWWGDGSPASRVENITGSGDRTSSGRRWSNAMPGYRDGYWGPAPVQSFAPNAFGLYDIGGNVSEWVQDCWHDNYIRAPRDGSAWDNPGCTRRVIRGGSWGSAPDMLRSAFRQGAGADTRSARVGFRVLREL